MRVLISAAEISSDIHGANLIRALKKVLPSNERLDVFGIGGRCLKEAGVDTVVDARDLLAMGTSEVLGRLPRIIRAGRVLLHEARERHPDVALVVDYPDFHFRLARKLKRMGIPLVYFIPPKIWIWRKGRRRLLERWFDLILYIFPMEKNVYRDFAVPAYYVGNPLLDELPLGLSREDARQKLAIAADRLTVAVMPGSRPAEIRRHFGVMLEAADLAALAFRKAGILKDDDKLQVVVPVPAGADLAEMKRNSERVRLRYVEVKLVDAGSAVALAAADAGLIKSGTSTLEAALMGCPHVVVYKPSPITSFLFKKFVRYRGPVALSNLVLQKKGRHFSEILMEEVTAPRLARELVGLMTDQERMAETRDALVRVREALSADNGGQSSGEAAAKKIWELHLKGLGRRESYARQWHWLVWAGSTLWSLGTRAARLLLKWGVLVRHRLPVRVVSVGNIQSGGTGKTPLVIAILKEAIARGLRVGVLSRGYRSSWEKTGGLISPRSPAVLPEHCGDEVALIHDQVPEAWLSVGWDRLEAGRRLVAASGGLDLIVMDDGFQNLRVVKDLEIVAVTSARRDERLFRGFSHELKKAGLLIWTKGNERPAGTEGRTLARIRYRIQKLPTHGPLWLVSGVADNSNFLKDVIAAGYEVHRHVSFADHYRYSRDAIETFVRECEREGCHLATTGKDWIKWRALIPGLAGVLVLEPEIEWLEGRELWSQKLWGA